MLCNRIPLVIPQFFHQFHARNGNYDEGRNNPHKKFTETLSYSCNTVKIFLKKETGG